MNKKKYIADFLPSTCDKCQKPVPKENSVLLIQDIATERIVFAQDRHLYPTEDCEGSPSRVVFVKLDPAWADAYNLVMRQTKEPD